MAKTDTDPRAPIVREWRGEPHYTCPFTETCRFDTLDEDAMTAHLDPVTGRHPVATEPRPVALSAEERAELEAFRAAKTTAAATKPAKPEKEVE